MLKNEPGKPDKKTPLIIAGFAIVIFAIATYLNYGPATHHVGSAASAVQVASNGAGG